MFKPTLWNLWDYIVDEGCLRTDCGTEEYLIKWNWQHRVPVKLEDISWWATKYGITLPPQWADKEVTLIEDLPFDEKSIFIIASEDGSELYRPFETGDQVLTFMILWWPQWEDEIRYTFPVLWTTTDIKPYYSSLNYPEWATEVDDFESSSIKMIIDFFWKPVLLTYEKTHWDEEGEQNVREYILDSQWNPLNAEFSNFSFDDTTVKWFESLHFEIDWIKFNMNPHHPYFPDWFKFDDENMEYKDWIDYDVVLKLAQRWTQNILEDNTNYYSMIWNRYRTWPQLDTERWLQWADIYWWKIIDVYDKALNKKLMVNVDAWDDPTPLIENLFWLSYEDKTIIEEHTYCTVSFVVWDKSITPEPMKWLLVTISDESNYQSAPSVEWDAELTLIDNVLSSLTNEQKYSLFLFFERLSFNAQQSLVLPRETLESEETFRRFIVSLLSDEWDIIDQR